MERCLRPAGCRGFTILEVFAAIAIFAILASFALPAIKDLAPSVARRNAVKQVSFHLQRAKNEALAQGARSILAFEDSGTRYSVGLDYFPFNEPPAADEVIFGESLPDSVTAAAAAPVIFDSRGFVVSAGGMPTSGELQFAHKEERYGTIVLNAAGAMTITY